MISYSPSWNTTVFVMWPLQWIKSYFPYRYQFVQFNQTCSPMQTIKCGVPQGSILGPLFFILYINDLPNASELIELLLFADDTSIFYSHSNPKTLESVLNNETKKILKFGHDVNKLSVNVKKNDFISFSNLGRRNVTTTFLSPLAANF